MSLVLRLQEFRFLLLLLFPPHVGARPLPRQSSKKTSPWKRQPAFPPWEHLLLPQPGGLPHLLPGAFGGRHLLLDALLADPLLLLLGPQLRQPLLLLAQPLLQLLALRIQWPDLLGQLLAGQAALPLFLQPAAGAARHFAQAAAGEFHGAFSAAAGLLGGFQLGQIGAGLEGLLLLAQAATDSTRA